MIVTPDGLKYALADKAISLTNLKTLIIDEADELLSRYMPQIEKVIKEIAKYGIKTNIGFLSATLSEDSNAQIDNLLEILEAEQQKMRILKFSATPTGQDQSGDDFSNCFVFEYCYRIQPGIESKSKFIADLIRGMTLTKNNQTIIFLNSKFVAHKTVDFLKKSGISAAALCGGMMPKEKFENLKAFTEGKYQCLVTTNLLARGFDYRNIGLVINFDLPTISFGEEKGTTDWKTYQHRIGRTGRFGDQGMALNFFSSPKEEKTLNEICQQFNLELKPMKNVKSEENKANDGKPEKKAMIDLSGMELDDIAEALDEKLDVIMKQNEKKRREFEEKEFKKAPSKDNKEKK